MESQSITQFILKLINKLALIFRKEDKIFIFGHYGEKNTGDDALIYVLLQEIYKVYPNINCSIISSRELFVPPQTKDKIKIIKPSLIPVFREIMRSSIFIMGGGTQIYDYGKKFERLTVLSELLIITLWAKIFCDKIYFWNIGLESFKTTMGKFISKNICKLADFISVRDEYSCLILKDLGIKNIELSFDSAVLLPPLNNNKPRFNKIEIIGLSLLPFYEIYQDKPEIDSILTNQIACTLNEWLKQNSNNKLHLFIFKGKSRSDDHKITHDLKEKIENIEQLEIIEYKPNPLVTLREINKCDMFIGMRYHSCLFAYIVRAPLLIISYFHKCDALADEIILPKRAVILIEEVLNGKFGEIFSFVLNNKEDFIGSLPISKAKKKSIKGLNLMDIRRT
jgi:polysaccharide pyruvyl transferase WcaK-like protein